MKRRDLIKSLTMTALSGGAFMLGATAADAAENAKKPNGKALAIGQSLRFDEGLKLTFVAVRNDNRCPINAMCVSAGDAEVLLLAYLDGQPAKLIKVHTDLEPRFVVLSAVPPGKIGIPKSYTVSVASLTPLPKVGKKRKQSDYRVTLDIKVAL